MDDLVSIITPMYNSEKYIAKTIESVIAQGYKNWEHIIVDDCSSDSSVEIVREFAKKEKRIKLIQKKNNEGVAATRNYGIQNAKGAYIAFLDSDDLWKNNKLEEQIAFMKKNDIAFSYTEYEVCDANGRYIKDVIPCRQRLRYVDLLKANDMACCTIIIKSDIVLNMPSIGHEDYATWLNILKKYDVEAVCLCEKLSVYRKTEGSISSNKLKTIKWIWNIYFNNQNLGIIKSIYCLVRFYIRTIKKYLIG